MIPIAAVSDNLYLEILLILITIFSCTILLYFVSNVLFHTNFSFNNLLNSVPSHNFAVIQHVEPAKLFDLPTAHSHTTVDSNNLLPSRSLLSRGDNKSLSTLNWFLPQKQLTPPATSAIHATQRLLFLQSELQLLNSIDKLQASIVRLNVESSQNSNNLAGSRSRPQFDHLPNKSVYYNLPPRCFYCNITGHVQRDCRKKRHDMARCRYFSNFNKNNFQRRVTFQDQRSPFRDRPQTNGFSGYNDTRQFSGARNTSPNRRNFSPYHKRNCNNNQYTRNNSASQREN
jgi:hypothetical protein